MSRPVAPNLSLNLVREHVFLKEQRLLGGEDVHDLLGHGASWSCALSSTHASYINEEYHMYGIHYVCEDCLASTGVLDSLSTKHHPKTPKFADIF